MAVLSVFSGDVWVVIFLALVLKLPLIGDPRRALDRVSQFDEDRPASAPSGRPDGALRLLRHAHRPRLRRRRAARAGPRRSRARTGQAAFDVEIAVRCILWLFLRIFP